MAQSDTIKVKITMKNGGKTTARPPLTVNGQTVDYKLDAEQELPAAAVEAAENSDSLQVERLGEGAAEGPGGANGGATNVKGGTNLAHADGEMPTHDDEIAPEADAEETARSIPGTDDDGSDNAGNNTGGDDTEADEAIEGTVDEVSKRIAKIDDPEMLDRLDAAEVDREKPRKGVREAIEARRKELAGE